MMEFIRNIIRAIVEFFNRKPVIQRIRKKIINEMTSEKMDRLLELLLEAMKILFWANRDFKSNINKFKAVYSFKTKDGKMGASAVFTRGFLPGSYKMKVVKQYLPDNNVEVTFKDGRSLCELLLSENPDIFNGILENKLEFSGNLSYLMKFVYMSRHIAYTFGLVS